MRTNYAWLLMFLLLLAGCDHSAHKNHSQHAKHPDTADIEGKADMEGMDHGQSHADMIRLSDREQLLAGIATDTVHLQDFQQAVTALGVIATDAATVSAITAKVNGRIERLYARNPGEDIREGEPLFDLYSEELLADEYDLLRFRQAGASGELIEAARQKLKLHGLSDKQVAQVEARKDASPYVKISSPRSGFLSALRVREGQYVTTGELLFEVASLDQVQVNVQVYPGEIRAFSRAAEYRVESGELLGKQYVATALYETPALEPNSKILQVRLRVMNPDHLLRPGMMTTVKAVSGTEKRLLIPFASVLEENGMLFTWIREPDGMFSRRMIRTGQMNETNVEVTSGLQPGERIVTSGIYLLNSEYILRKGANSMGGMKM